MQQKKYDRAAEDQGNIVGIGHVNVCITDQHHGTDFYVTGLGYTRDPFLNTTSRNMWINVGMSQFHLPMGTPDVLRGVVGLVSPDRDALLDRLARVRKSKQLDGTKFDFRESNDCVETVCPWGNRIHVHTPDPERFGRIQLGMPYVRFDVRPGTAERIARFYREISMRRRRCTRTAPGPRRECRSASSSISISARPTRRRSPTTSTMSRSICRTFSGPYRKLLDLGLITAESNQYEYRFKDVIDLDTKEVLFTVEHETRSQTNPMYGRPLINRNPAATNMDYKPGHDGMSWALP